MRKWADAEDEPDAKYRDAHVWYDNDKKDNFGAYKLLIADVVDGRLTAVPRGVMAAAAVMQGSRGGVDLPKDDIAGVKSHLAKYYAKMGDTAPWFGTDRTSRRRLWEPVPRLPSRRVAEEGALDGAEVVHDTIAGSGLDEPLPDGVERRQGNGLQTQMVDAAATPHRNLSVRLGVAVDHEDIQLGVRTDADYCHRLAAAPPMRSGFADVGVEHLRVERAKPRNIIRYQRNMVQPVQQHRFLLYTHE